MGLLGHGGRQLAEQIVRQDGALQDRDIGLRAHRIECRKRPVTHARAVDREQRRDLVVAAAAAEDQREHRTLVSWQVV